MKQLLLLITILSFGVTLLGQSSLLIQTKGKVERTQNSSSWIVAKRADTLNLGDRIKTLSKGQAIVRFGDGSILRIAERTEIYFPISNQQNVREVNVLRGLLTYDVKANQSEPFKFKSPTAVAAIKGTTGTFETDGRATNFVVENSDSKEEVAEFESNRGETKNLRIGEVAVLNRTGRLTLRDIFESERNAIRSQVEDMRKTVEAEIQKMREEVEKIKEEMKQQIQSESDSLKKELEDIKNNDFKKEQEDIKNQGDQIKEEMEKTKDEIKKLFER